MSKEHMFDERICETMNKRNELIERINQLTPEQFEQLIALFQQEQESVQVSQSDRQTSLQPCG
jgi:hypothetical protein